MSHQEWSLNAELGVWTLLIVDPLTPKEKDKSRSLGIFWFNGQQRKNPQKTFILLVLFWDHTWQYLRWLCAQGSLLVGVRVPYIGYIGCQGLNLGRLHARQAPYLLYHSSPQKQYFIRHCKLTSWMGWRYFRKKEQYTLIPCGMKEPWEKVRIFIV